MANQPNTIVLNGKLYDAVTGVLIHDQATIAPKVPKLTVSKKKTQLVMDGVVRKPAKAHKATKKTDKPAHHAPASRAHHKPAHATGHKPQKAATLMRHAVRKPAHTEHHKHTEPEKPAHIHDERTARRLERAAAVQKSHHIQRFPVKHEDRPAVTKKHAPLKVEPTPAPEPPIHVAPAMSASEKLVTNALKNARSHEAHKPFAKKPKKRLSHKLGFKRKTANLAMGSLAVLLLAGFFVYQNVPNISMQVASQRAGFSAQLPSYKPAGFSQNNLVSYSPGKVTVSFHSNSDEREFKLSQQVSNWNSQALVDNYLAKADKPYQTYQASGKTVYIYSDSSATWVSGGVWYQIEGQSSLNSDQLLKIANSI